MRSFRSIPETEVRSIDVLHGKPEVDQVPVRRDVHGLRGSAATSPPCTEGMFVLGSTTLSPLRAESGIKPEIRDLQARRESGIVSLDSLSKISCE